METDTTVLDGLYGVHVLVDVKKGYMKQYANIVVEMEKLRKKQEDLLTALVKEAQTSAKEGLNIENLLLHVDLYEDDAVGHFLYAVRTVSKEGSDDRLELKLMSERPNEYEWISIYDFYTETAWKILSKIMEKR